MAAHRDKRLQWHTVPLVEPTRDMQEACRFLKNLYFVIARPYSADVTWAGFFGGYVLLASVDP